MTLQTATTWTFKGTARTHALPLESRTGRRRRKSCSSARRPGRGCRRCSRSPESRDRSTHPGTAYSTGHSSGHSSGPTACGPTSSQPAQPPPPRLAVDWDRTACRTAAPWIPGLQTEMYTRETTHFRLREKTGELPSSQGPVALRDQSDGSPVMRKLFSLADLFRLICKYAQSHVVMLSFIQSSSPSTNLSPYLFTALPLWHNDTSLCL